MAANKGNSIVDEVTALAAPEAQRLGLSLWDVRYEKEGSEWFLKVLLDRPEGVSVDDCETLSRILSDKLDEADPIEDSYYLEVSSAGLERAIVKEEHFAYALGKAVLCKLYRPLNGEKSISGILKEKRPDSVLIAGDDGTELVLPLKDIASIKLQITDF